MFLLLGWECREVKATFSGPSGPKRPSENVGLTPQHSQHNNKNMKDRRFSVILHYCKENSLKHSENS